MKKALVLLLLAVFAAMSLHAEGRLSLSFSYPVYNSRTTDVYGQKGFLPGLNLNWKLFGRIYLYGDIGYYSASGTTIDELQEKCRLTKTFIGAGLEWQAGSRRFYYFMRGGPSYCIYRESVENASVSGSALGLDAVTGLASRIGRSVLMELFAGYTWIDRKIFSDEPAVSLGGFKAGLGLGIGL